MLTSLVELATKLGRARVRAGNGALQLSAPVGEMMTSTSKTLHAPPHIKTAIT